MVTDHRLLRSETRSERKRPPARLSGSLPLVQKKENDRHHVSNCLCSHLHAVPFQERPVYAASSCPSRDIQQSANNSADRQACNPRPYQRGSSRVRLCRRTHNRDLCDCQRRSGSRQHVNSVVRSREGDVPLRMVRFRAKADETQVGARRHQAVSPEMLKQRGDVPSKTRLVRVGEPSEDVCPSVVLPLIERAMMNISTDYVSMVTDCRIRLTTPGDRLSPLRNMRGYYRNPAVARGRCCRTRS